MTIAHINAEIVPDRDGSGRFQKGRPHGRPPGARNKTTSAVKDALRRSFEEVGIVHWLVDLARTHPQAYATLLGKLLPAELKVEASTDELPVFAILDFTCGKN